MSNHIISTHANYADVVKWRNDITQRLSDYLRSSGVGILIFCWGLTTADKGFAQTAYKAHPKWIMLTAVIAATALFIDLLHFVCSFLVTDRMKLAMEKEKVECKPFPTGSITYRLVYIFFWLKILLMPLAFVSVIAILFSSLR
jgi:hypothetical protein